MKPLNLSTTNSKTLKRLTQSRRRSPSLRFLSAAVLSILIALPALAQDKDKEKKSDKPSGQPDSSEMMNMMMEMAKLGDNHKLLSHGVGTWTYKVKMWMNGDPSTPANESSGTATTRAIMGGRYFVSDHTGNFQMPGPDGKMMDMEFKGMSLEGYDNAKKKFVATWVDNMGTGIMHLEGDYDASAKTFTYRAEYEAMPGMKMKIREVIKIADHDNHTFEWYEDRGGTEVKTMEISYTRKA